MDAPTSTSSADGGDSGGNSGDWGWFTPSRKGTEPGERRASTDGPEGGPSRPVSRIRPVGSGAERRSGAATAEPEPGPAGPGPGRIAAAERAGHRPAGAGDQPARPAGSGMPDSSGPRTTVPRQGVLRPVSAAADPLSVPSLYREEHQRPAEPALERTRPPAEPPVGAQPPARTPEQARPPERTRAPERTSPEVPAPVRPAEDGRPAGATRPGAAPRPAAGHGAERPAGPGEPGSAPQWRPAEAAPAWQGPGAAGDRDAAPFPPSAMTAAGRAAEAPPATGRTGARPTGADPDGNAVTSAGPVGGPDRTGPAGIGPDRTGPGPARPVTGATVDRPGHDSALALAFAAPRPATGTEPEDAELIRRTMAEVEPIADKVTSYFYALLFVQNPELRALFPASMDSQRDRLFKALLTAARLVDDPRTLTAYLSGLGRGHRKYGTRPEHYPAVGECLIGALTRYAAQTWDAEAEAAWVRAYTIISQIMIDAAAEDELHNPAWWQAEVVSHELRTPDIAVVTVRPDQPYPFLAGQYTTLETPWWPRVWRHYSFASAPRSDGLLCFHVKAVPAGWVSSALVHRARPGDVIRLGPPAGSMTVDHTTDTGLLCLGGGTGIAPIKALVEDVAEHGRTRPVEVFYGARSDHDLYDMDTMLELDRVHPWLSVRPVVSDGPTNGLSGQLPDAVRRYGPWNAYDAYLSGPPGMIRSSMDALVGAGVPTHRIRHDSIEELVATGD